MVSDTSNWYFEASFSFEVYNSAYTRLQFFIQLLILVCIQSLIWNLSLHSFLYSKVSVSFPEPSIHLLREQPSPPTHSHQSSDCYPTRLPAGRRGTRHLRPGLTQLVHVVSHFELPELSTILLLCHHWSRRTQWNPDLISIMSLHCRELKFRSQLIHKCGHS